jgi:hypothetical protein
LKATAVDCGVVPAWTKKPKYAIFSEQIARYRLGVSATASERTSTVLCAQTMVTDLGGSFMQQMLRLLLTLAFLLVCSTMALGYECDYQGIATKKNRIAGTAVINQFNVYCGKVVRANGGYSVKMEGEKAEFFDSNHSYEDVLHYVCNKCGLKTIPQSLGKP